MYLKKDLASYTTEEASEHLADQDHLGGMIGNIWSGIHPPFNKGHSMPFTAVIDLKTAKVIATDPIPQVLTADEVLSAVEEAANN